LIGVRAAILTAALALLLAPMPAQAQVSDVAVKAAFLPRFARYVTWPPNGHTTGPMTICVIGDDPFGGLLNQAATGQQVDGRSFMVKHLGSPAGASACNIAFVGGSRAGEILAGLARQPVLTVTDSRSGSPRGMVHFAIVDGRVRFFIDNAQAQSRGLTISSRLLALAIGVNQR
jgi:uncharacterized protein DUF4154